jgi:hypothetical protein
MSPLDFKERQRRERHTSKLSSDDGKTTSGTTTGPAGPSISVYLILDSFLLFGSCSLEKALVFRLCNSLDLVTFLAETLPLQHSRMEPAGPNRKWMLIWCSAHKCNRDRNVYTCTARAQFPKLSPVHADEIVSKLRAHAPRPNQGVVC